MVVRLDYLALSNAQQRSEYPGLSAQIVTCNPEQLTLANHVYRFDCLNHDAGSRCRSRALHRTQASFDGSEIADDLLQETSLQMHRSRAAHNPDRPRIDSDVVPHDDFDHPAHPSNVKSPRKVEKLDLLEFNDGCGMSRRSKKSQPELGVTRCYIALDPALNVVLTRFSVRGAFVCVTYLDLTAVAPATAGPHYREPLPSDSIGMRRCRRLPRL